MGMAVAATAYAGRYGIQAWQAFKARPPTARMRKFYEGGFQAVMTRREAALILGSYFLLLLSDLQSLELVYLSYELGLSDSDDEYSKGNPLLHPCKRMSIINGGCGKAKSSLLLLPDWFLVTNLYAYMPTFVDEPCCLRDVVSICCLLLHFSYAHHGKESTAADKVKEAHRRVMVANHPDAGGSHYLASKINEAKDILLGKTKSGGSAF
ncbi:hypothetical protein OIU77_030688 [Salix suchowensis]|uniref:J domain-containing protein n=1 Tax=Salix suchowensis TaxID=1278906 RepID=A0ABQ9BCY1_9ROSI|nr:hypothetical protein OIU77_030688 [Salix suchowensis]